ncbi:MAG: hypothetical protein AB2L14_16925 [Candidatus Xenobiia bacterium LiM19]
MASGEKLTKFAIKAVLKDLQAREHFKTLAELKDSLEKELREEGFEIIGEDREKIAAIVEEDGYTGRFAIDDLIMKKLKNKKYWPIVSIAVAILVFIISSAVGGLIEFYVQKPLSREKSQDPASTVIAAVFQIPEKIYGEKLEFTVNIQNLQKSEALSDLVLFASADDRVTKISVGPLDPAAHKKIKGILNLKDIRKARVTFNAYIISSKVSFVAEPVEIEKSSVVAADMGEGNTAGNTGNLVAVKEREVAMASKLDTSATKGSLPSASSSHKAIAAQSSLTASGSAQGPQGKAAGPQVSAATPQSTAATAQGTAAETSPFKNITAKEMNSDRLVEASIEALKNLRPGEASYESRRGILTVLAESGNQKAALFLRTLGK